VPTLDLTDLTSVIEEVRARNANGGGSGRHPVALLVEAMRYNPEGRGFDSR
jgi:hypothetical protein